MLGLALRRCHDAGIGREHNQLPRASLQEFSSPITDGLQALMIYLDDVDGGAIRVSGRDVVGDPPAFCAISSHDEDLDSNFV